VFSLPYREDPERIYALTIDVARAAGYRDSLYFLRKNPEIIKLELEPMEKDMLIEQGRIASHLKTRAVTCVTIHNAFKTHGALIIKSESKRRILNTTQLTLITIITDGRYVTDDYYEAKARQEGKKEGAPVNLKTYDEIQAERREKDRDLRDRDRDRDRSHRRRTDANSHQSVNPQTGDNVVTTFGDSGNNPFVRAEGYNQRLTALAREEITETNWMMRYAENVRGINSELRDTRRDRLVVFRMPKEGLESESDYSDTEDEEDAEDEEDGSEDRMEVDGDMTGKSKPGLANGNVDLDPSSSGSRKIQQLSKDERKRQLMPPIGVYDPYTHLPHFSQDTQPTWAHMEKVRDVRAI
jgi:chromatin structure-remodeling complex protein RSC7